MNGIVFKENPYNHFACNSYDRAISASESKKLPTLVEPNSYGILPDHKFDVIKLDKPLNTIQPGYIVVPSDKKTNDALLFISSCGELLKNNYDDINFIINENVQLVTKGNLVMPDKITKITNIACILREGQSLVFKQISDNDDHMLMVRDYTCKDGNVVERQLSYQEKMQEDYERFSKRARPTNRLAFG
jgi:hypothetical protein